MKDNNIQEYIILLCLFLIAFFIRVVGVSNNPMYGDEWIYWTNVNRILENNFIPREDVFGFAPPSQQYLGAIITLLFEGDLNILRMVSVVLGSLTVPMLYLFGKAMFDRNTGLLSAFFLCFSAYHILYSRIFMLEVPTLFFITAFLYFFWLSQNYEGQKSMTCAIVAGSMLGLAFDTKYIAFFLIPGIIAYILWTNKFNLKALMDKTLLLTFTFTALLTTPIFIGLHISGAGLDPFYYMTIGKFEKAIVGHTRASDLPINELILGGGNKVLEVLTTWGADVVIPWAPLFKLAAFLIFIISIHHYFQSFINREKKSSFLIILLFTLFTLLLVIGRMRHYVLYAVPFYFVMLSHLIVITFYNLKIENGRKNIYRVFVILLAIIIIFSSFITGITSSQWDEGDYNPWVKSVVNYIEHDATRSQYEDVSVGVIYYVTEILDYPFYLSELNVTTIYVFKPSTKYTKDIAILDLDKIDRLKPEYLVVSNDFYANYFRGNVQKEIFKDYMIVFQSKTYPHTGFVLKRKNIQPSESLQQMNGKEGNISIDIFKQSVPSVMKVGEVYTTQVKVKNTGESTTDFAVKVHSDMYTIFVNEKWHVSPTFLDKDWYVTLSSGSTHTFEINIIPFREHDGKLPVTIDLSAKYDDGIYRIVNSSTDYVNSIKR